jgi:hypothetical protein
LLKDWEVLLFFNAAETTFTLPPLKEEVDPMVFVENNDVDDAAPPKEDDEDAEAGCANARRRS